MKRYFPRPQGFALLVSIAMISGSGQSLRADENAVTAEPQPGAPAEVPAAEPATITEPAPAAEPAPAPVDEPAPVVDAAPVIEPAPVVEPAPAVDPAPAVEAVPEVETPAPAVEATPAADPFASPEVPGSVPGDAPAAPVEVPVEIPVDAPAVAPTETPAAEEAVAPGLAAPTAISADEIKDAALTAEQQKVIIATKEKEALKILDNAMGAYNNQQYGKALDLFENTLKNLRPREANLKYVDLAREKGSDSAYQLAKGMYDRRKEGGSPDDAAPYITKALDLNSKNADARNMLSLLEKWREDLDKGKRPEIRDMRDTIVKTQSVEQKLKLAREYLDVKDYDKTEAVLEEVLSIEKYNRDAMKLLAKTAREKYEFQAEHHKYTIEDMREKVEKSWNRPIGQKGIGPVTQGTKTEADPKESSIEKKMRELVIDDLSFVTADINEVFKNLQEISRELDKQDKIGINFILLIDQASGAPAGGAAAPAADPFATPADDLFGSTPAAAASPTVTGGAIPPITISLRQVTIKDALKYICDIANLYYQIEGNVVMITRSGDIRNVSTRFYPVDPTLMQSILQMAPPTTNGIGDPAAAGGGFDAAPAGGGTGDLKEIFKGFGVPFPPGTSIRYEPAITQIVVSNTPENLEKFEAVLPKFNVQPRQVEIEARFVEVLQSELREMGFEWIFTDPYEIASQKGAPLAARPRIQLDANPLGATQANRSFYFDSVNRSISPGSRATNSGETSSASPLGNLLSISGVLTNPELQMVLHAMDQRGNTDLLSAPRVTTLSGINAVIEVVREIIYPTEFDVSENDIQVNGGGGGNQVGAQVPFIPPTVIPGAFETREVGVILNVTPTVSPDNYTINLQLLPEIAELVDWIQYGTTIGLENGQSFVVNMPQPIFASRNVTTSMTVWDGYTVVMGGLIREDLVTINDRIPLLGDIPLLGRLFRNEGSKSDKRNLLIFVTARLVDPAGNPVNKGGVANVPVAAP